METSHLLKYIVVYEIILAVIFVGAFLFFGEEQQQESVYKNAEETTYGQLSMNLDEGRCVDELSFNITDYGLKDSRIYIILFPEEEREYRKELIQGQNVTISDAPFLPINESTVIPYQILIMTDSDIDGGTYIGGNMTFRVRDKDDNV